MGFFSVFDWKKKEIGFVGVVLLVTLGISWAQLIVGEMKTRDAQRKADVDLVARGVAAYHDDHKKYPPSQDGKIVSCGDKADQPCEWGDGPVRDEEGVVYIRNLPRDPFFGKGRKYVYEVDKDGKGFKVYTAIENQRDPGIRHGLTVECGSGVQCNWYAKN